ncbi:MAG: hypothetical protein ACP5UL_02930, partial [Thermoplasmata archaeon]
FIEESNGNLMNIGLNGSHGVINWIISNQSLSKYQPVLIRFMVNSSVEMDEVLLVGSDGNLLLYSATGYYTPNLGSSQTTAPLSNYFLPLVGIIIVVIVAAVIITMVIRKKKNNTPKQ